MAQPWVPDGNLSSSRARVYACPLRRVAAAVRLVPLPSLRPPALEIGREVPAQRNLEPRPTTLTFLARLAPGRVESRISQLSPSPAPARAHTRPGSHLLHKGIEFKAGVDSVAFAGKRYAKLMQRGLAFLLWDSADSLLQLRPCCPVIAPMRLRPLDLPASRHFRVPRISATSVAVAPVLSRTPAVCASRLCAVRLSLAQVSVPNRPHPPGNARDRPGGQECLSTWVTVQISSQGGCVRAHLSSLLERAVHTFTSIPILQFAPPPKESHLRLTSPWHHMTRFPPRFVASRSTMASCLNVEAA